MNYFSETLPEAVRRQCAAALAALDANPNYNLPPYQRLLVYRTLGPWQGQAGRLRRVRLALLAVDRAKLVWEHERPDDRRMLHLCEVAERLTVGQADAQAASEEAHATWKWLTNQYDDRHEDISDRAQMALQAALDAVENALGHPRFEFDGVDEIITEQTTEDNIDPWSSDAARDAAAAYAGPVWEPSSDREKRLEFWTWWLREAVPAAWRAVPEPDMR